MGGGNDEREQTINQLLTEMDGFEGNTGVIVLAATPQAPLHPSPSWGRPHTGFPSTFSNAMGLAQNLSCLLYFVI